MLNRASRKGFSTTPKYVPIGSYMRGNWFREKTYNKYTEKPFDTSKKTHETRRFLDYYIFLYGGPRIVITHYNLTPNDSFSKQKFTLVCGG